MSDLTISIVTIVALVVGPVIAVIIGYKLQNHKLEQEVKHRIFLTLMAHRKVVPPNAPLIESLNILDVVFHKHPAILKLWHEYFESLCQPKPTEAIFEVQKKKYLDLLSEIARTLKYKNLRQTDIDIFYSPVGRAMQMKKEADIQEELLRVLKNTESLFGTSHFCYWHLCRNTF